MISKEIEEELSEEDEEEASEETKEVKSSEGNNVWLLMIFAFLAGGIVGFVIGKWIL